MIFERYFVWVVYVFYNYIVYVIILVVGCVLVGGGCWVFEWRLSIKWNMLYLIIVIFGNI